MKLGSNYDPYFITISPSGASLVVWSSGYNYLYLIDVHQDEMSMVYNGSISGK
jgi:hypothetical protein